MKDWNSGTKSYFEKRGKPSVLDPQDKNFCRTSPLSSLFCDITKFMPTSPVNNKLSKAKLSSVFDTASLKEIEHYKNIYKVKDFVD
jgi:hypothetical protein